MSVNRKTALLLAAAALLGGGCQDLVVENTNSPDRRRALAQPDAVELLAASTFPIFYNRIYRGTAGYVPIPMTADEVTNTSNTSGGRDLSTLPRRPYDNNPVNDDQYVLVELTWSQHYEAFSNATDALKVINDGLVIETGDPVTDNTHRVRVFSKLMQGLTLGYIGLLFDQAYIFDENTPDEVIQDPIKHGLGLSPYTEVIAKAVELLEAAAQLAQSGEPFTIPSGWMYTADDVTPDDVANIAHAYAARYLVLSARTPAERQALDWQKVLSHTALVTNNVEVELGSNSSGRRNNYVARAHSTSSNSRWYASYRLIGAADVSGNYQAWLQTAPEDRSRFLITTPDRRITGADGPTSNGKYFRYLETNLFNPLYGGYRESFYQWNRYRNGVISNSGDDGIFAMLTMDEIRLYEAEAHYRMGQLELARDLINATRVANGELPAVTVDGVTDAADCVPRTTTGACGSLLDALVYERLIELAFLDPVRTWGDKRGFGALTTGTILHLPIPYEQQKILDIPYYTFGGNLPGSAP